MWRIGSVEVQRVLYFDTPLPAEAVGLEGVAETLDWANPWLSDGQPTVGQAFWVIRSAGKTLVVDPCGASDDFLRSGPEAVDHQTAAFAALVGAGIDPAEVDQVVLTHLDGIGMAALADGGAVGEERWSPAFPNARLVISLDEYDLIAASAGDVPGSAGFAALDEAGVVATVAPPFEVAPGVTMRQTGGHSVGHCCVEINSDGDRAVMLGHLAITPLSATGPSQLNVDPAAAWAALEAELHAARGDRALLLGSLWPSPGAARVVAGDPFVLEPA